MRVYWKSATLAMALASLSVLALLAWPHAASANPYFQKQTGLPCSACHNSGQENQGEQGLNPVGRAFKNCGFKLGCDDNARPAGPPPRPHTTEFFTGTAYFTGSCVGQQRWISIRPARNEQDRTMAIVLDPGQRLMIAVSTGTTYSASCGVSASPNSPFHYITLDIVAP
jgi:hypothetical protein